MARDEQQPMSDARLAEIRERLLTDGVSRWLVRRESLSPLSRWLVRRESLSLLAEVERLRAREAALVEIARAVAEAGVGDDYGGGTWLMFSGYDAETVREQARALLASE